MNTMSKGNIASAYPAKHVININIDRAKAVGLGSTNMTDFKALLNTPNFMKRCEPNFSYSTSTTVFDYINYLKGGAASYKYRKFNKETSTYSDLALSIWISVCYESSCF